MLNRGQSYFALALLNCFRMFAWAKDKISLMVSLGNSLYLLSAFCCGRLMSYSLWCQYPGGQSVGESAIATRPEGALSIGPVLGGSGHKKTPGAKPQGGALGAKPEALPTARRKSACPCSRVHLAKQHQLIPPPKHPARAWARALLPPGSQRLSPGHSTPLQPWSPRTARTAWQPRQHWGSSNQKTQVRPLTDQWRHPQKCTGGSWGWERAAQWASPESAEGKTPLGNPAIHFSPAGWPKCCIAMKERSAGHYSIWPDAG